MSIPERIFQTQSNDFQTAENVLAQADLEGLPPETRELLKDMVEDMGFEPRDVAAKKENKQHVLQGQLLVLGDSRKGKTSLIKAMTGGEFDPEENQTSGVEFKFVDRKWKTVELKNLKFGGFSQYSERNVYQKKNFPRMFSKDDHGEDPPSVRDILISNAPTLIVMVLPVIFGYFFGESNSRWLTYFLFMATVFYDVCKGIMSVADVLIMYFECLGTCIAYKLFGCSDKSLPMRFSLFVNELVTFDIIPPFLMHPFISFVLEWAFSVVSFLLIYCFLLPCLSKLPVRGNILLVFLSFKYHEEVVSYLGATLIVLQIFFAPIGLSCNYSSIIFSFKCVYIFLMHILLLYHQNILRTKYTTAVIALELSIILSLYFTGLGKVHIVLNIIANITLLVLGLGLHIYGKWLEVKDDFKGKSFSQVVWKVDFLLHTIQIKKALIDTQKLKNALNNKFCTLKLKILDFAGDEEYYAYHQIFLSSNALYVVVFNIQDYVNNDFKDPDCKLSKRLRFWLESIHSHVPHGTPIFLVGTHRADIPIETLKHINRCIRKAVWHSFSDEIVFNKEDDLLFFHVENSRGTADKGVLNLCQKIKSVAEDELKDVIGQEIPLSWIKVQDAIIKYQESQQGLACLTDQNFQKIFEQLFFHFVNSRGTADIQYQESCRESTEKAACVTVEYFKKRFEHLYIAWDDEMLKYFHKKGFIIYVDKDQGLSNWVLLNPDVLVQIVILLINQPKEVTNKREYTRHWLILKESGRITKTLLQFVLSQVGEQETEQSSLIAFLEEYDLLCPLKHPYGNMQDIPEIRQTHFVPSLLPKAESQRVWHESSEDIKFYIFFDNYLPQALFYRLLSRACKLSYDVKKRYEPVIYCDSGLFWLSEEQPYYLKLLKNEGLIEVTFSNTTDGMKPFDIVTLIAGSMVESICKRDFHNLSFHCGPECTLPTCPGSPSDNMSLFTGQRRRHMLNVYPACKQDRLDSFTCLNFLQDATIWKQ